MRLSHLAVLAIAVGGAATGTAGAADSCNTALSRVARAEAMRAIEANRQTVCEGLRSGEARVDKTEALELQHISLCENGPVVKASIVIRVACRTSPRAVFQVHVSEKLRADAVANLDTCAVTNARASASGFLVDALLKWGNADQKLSEEVARAIRPYCANQPP